MAKIIRKSGASTEEWPLGQTSLSIGRRPDNHIVLPDTFASGRHAMIGFVNGRYFVEDLKSSNGTILNGQRISRAPLKNGDVIYIGAQRLEFHDQIIPPDSMATTIMTVPLGQHPLPPPDATIPLANPPDDPIIPAPPPGRVAAPAPPPVAPPLAPPAPVAPPPAAALPSSPIAGFNFIMPDLEPPKPVETTRAGSDADPLEGMARSIRAHRDREQQDRQDHEMRMRAEWEKILVYCEGLQQKLKNDPRVRYFNVSRRSGEVSMRVQIDPKTPQLSISLSQEHPSHKTGNATGVWLRISGMQDRCHTSADAAIAELVRTVAFLFV
ncbi:FHA domain-containing protein [Solimonas sp. K1W22B-7]|uniref:FHA domain-containing protein n=1 Tax=Solimonas sp. K1W22B-7 TaxID=2303331 RepID=UPI00196967A2|nr:FHA domain-containing protein [Solimonas sp. K1W22B-7]